MGIAMHKNGTCKRIKNETLKNICELTISICLDIIIFKKRN